MKIFLHRTCEADVTRRRHVAKPREPTWTYVVQGAIGLAFEGPTG